MNHPNHPSTNPSRRSLLGSATFLAACAAGSALVAPSSSVAEPVTTGVANATEPFRYCLNTSTVRGSNLPLADVIDIASKAGFNGIEPWINEIEKSVQKGTSTADLKKRIDDAGLKVESAIGFAEWIVNDDARRAKGLEAAKHDMDMLLELGGKRLAAPPVGATQPKDEDVSVEKIADRYKALAELGAKAGIVTMAEVWGFSKTFKTLNETVKAAMLSGHPKACILPDVYHLYKGGSSFDDMKQLTNTNFQVLHVNDYPDIARDKIADKDRVYPGDGIAPYAEIIKDLKAIKYAGLATDAARHERNRAKLDLCRERNLDAAGLEQRTVVRRPESQGRSHRHAAAADVLRSEGEIKFWDEG